MAKNASDVLCDGLIDWGVEVVFGLPGDGINGVIEALRKRKEKIRFIHVRHEESAALMACAYAKYTGRLGVCVATSGPGGIHLLNGLYDAKLDGQPVLAITGHAYHDLIDTGTQQDVDLDRVFMDVAVYTTRVMGAAHVPNVLHLACRKALAYRGVAHINIPTDVQEQDVKDDDRSERNVPERNRAEEVFGGASRVPSAEGILRASEVLNAGKKVAILAGRGALGASEELLEAAEILGAPIIKALLGKACVPDDSPYTTGGIGLLGTEPSEEAMGGCDTLLIAGSTFPYIEFYPKPDDVRAVQIDLDPARIGLRFPIEVGLVGDTKRTLQELLPLLRRKDDRSFLESAQKGMREWMELLEERGTRRDKPMKPQVVARELGRRLRDDAIVSADSGTNTVWAARHIPVRGGQMFSVSGTLATMANALPYTIAAQIAYPDRQCVGFVGDGGFSMLMGEFATAVQYRLPIKIVIVKNNSLGQIKWEQMAFLGNPEYVCELSPIDFAAVARACGGAGYTIEDPAECGAILDEALADPRPTLIEAVVDPNEPPMPAKVKAKHALHMAEALAKGTPDRMEIIRTVLEDKVRELV
jgi:pyruvate dehydrogenase (quinone)